MMKDECRRMNEQQCVDLSFRIHHSAFIIWRYVMGTFLQDLRYGVRMLLRKPGFTVVAILALALGIGVNSAIFSVVNAVLLRPLPFAQPERLVMVFEKFTRQGLDQIPVSAQEFLDYQKQNEVFEQIAAFTTATYNMTGTGEPEQIQGAVVSASLFPLLGVKPLQGRAFLPEENEVGHENVVLVSQGLWQRRFGSDPALVGKQLSLNGKSYTVVGIMPSDFQFPLSLFDVQGFQFTQKADMWTPVTFSQALLDCRSCRGLGVIGRLKPGVTLAQANASVDALAQRWLQEHPDTYGEGAGWGASAVSLHEQVIGKVRKALFVLLGAVGFVLLIACANVANLLLARAASRQKEMAIRVAMGASRWRLVRQMLTESLMLSVTGGALGLLLAMWGTDALVALSPENIPRVEEIGLDARVLSFTVIVSLLTGIIFGLAPAFQASRATINDALKEGGKGTAGVSSGKRMRGVLVVAEVALSLVLLIGAGLFIRSFTRLTQVDPGFNPEHVLTMELSLPRANYPDKQKAATFYQQIIQRIQSLPGVQAAAATTILPLSGSNSDSSFVIEGRMPRDAGEVPDEEIRVITPDYFRALGVPLIRGRFFTDADAEKAPQVLIINQALARKYFAGEDPLGKRITFGDPRRKDAVWATIIGVVGDVKHRGLNVQAKPEYYLPNLQDSQRALILAVRTNADPASMVAAVRQEILAVDKDQPVANIRTMTEVISTSVAPQRLSTMMFLIFACVALVLAAVGIYGVMAYSVSQRTHEIGIRMALGAQRGDVLRMVIKEGMTLALIGVVIGLAASYALTRVISTLLYDVSVTDPAIFVGLSLLLALVALLACGIPARRATKVDPMVALRYE
jgi:putative ABC transport system permease protein